MWTEFACMVALVLVILYLPGTLFFKAFRPMWLESIVYAPLYSAGSLAVTGVVNNKLGIASNVISLCAPMFACAALCFLASVFIGRIAKAKHACVVTPTGKGVNQGPHWLQRLWRKIYNSEWSIACLYVVVAAVLTVSFYVMTLDGAASFAQDSDNSYHLSLIQSFVQSGNMSILDAGLYHDLEGSGLSTLQSTVGSFYPAAWHILAALAVLVIAAPVSVAANAVNVAFLLSVLPLGLYAMNSAILKNRIAVALGAFVALGFVAFPWGMLLSVSGPLFPNFIGIALVPAWAALFIQLFKPAKVGERIVSVGLLAIGLVALAVAHPNAVFTAVVLLAPFVCAVVMKRFAKPDWPQRKCRRINTLIVAVFALLWVLLWIVLYKLPVLQGVVSYSWESYATPVEELFNIVSLGFRMPVAQGAMAVLVIAGIVYLLYKRKERWLVVSYAIACLFCFVSATTDGFLKSFLTGFWYTDPYRLAAVASLIAIPIATIGLYAVWLAAKTLASRTVFDGKTQSKIACVAMALVLCLFVCVNYYSEHDKAAESDRYPAFTYYCGTSAKSNMQKRDNLFDQEEQAFCKQVVKVVDPQYCIYNNADDGSAFAYALDGLNLCYRRSAAQLLDGGEPAQSELLRLHINELATNQDVRDALTAANIKYILVLDLGGEATEDRCFYGYYTPEKWAGINAINDDTPGLRLLLSGGGDMRVYEIV